MRLINVETRRLEEFFGREIPKYAILSHTWGDEEVTFSQFDSAESKEGQGWEKIAFTCAQAAEDGLPYVWIDTCSIDKSSSAELSEAINSMFRWYQSSTRCYVYLSDVSRESLEEHFPASRWFRRGWTLQELLAPDTVIFYDSKWQPLGTKHDLWPSINVITGIDPLALHTPAHIHTLSVAKRMSWASNRETTRLEDMAYSLMGLFQVSMPLLYGEGSRAFFRLQEEIIKKSSDDSILAWGLEGQKHPLTKYTTIEKRDIYSSECLAQSPKHFKHSSALEAGRRDGSFSLTNLGLEITLPIVCVYALTQSFGLLRSYDDSVWIGILHCRTSVAVEIVGIILAPFSLSSDGTYTRARFHNRATSAVLVDARLVSKAEIRRITIHLPENSGSMNYNSFTGLVYQVVLNKDELEHLDYTVSSVTLANEARGKKEVKDESWDPESEILTLDPEFKLFDALQFGLTSSKGFPEFSVLLYIGFEATSLKPGPAVIRSGSILRQVDFKNLESLWKQRFGPRDQILELKIQQHKIPVVDSDGHEGLIAVKVSGTRIRPRNIYEVNIYVEKSADLGMSGVFQRLLSPKRLERNQSL